MPAWRLVILLPALFALAMSAAAEESADESTAAPAETLDDEVILSLEAFEDTGTLSDEELSSHRARENIEVSVMTINDQDQDGDVTENVAIGNTNGDNLINGEAFSDSSGFLSTVQNTGNNVLIQNSTIINVTVETPTN